VATALLVAGSTLTFWIPWQTLFASTMSYSSIIQSARRLAYSSFQLTHMSCDDMLCNWSSHSGSDGGKDEDKHYFSAHNDATRVSFGT